jgi:hypothetical protein
MSPRSAWSQEDKVFDHPAGAGGQIFRLLIATAVVALPTRTRGARSYTRG